MSDPICKHCWAKGFEGCQCVIAEDNEPTSRSADTQFVKSAIEQLEHIKKWYNGSQSIDELRHAIDHALSDLKAVGSE